MAGINKAKFAVAGLVVAALRYALGSGSSSQTSVKLILWSHLWPCHADALPLSGGSAMGFAAREQAVGPFGEPLLLVAKPEPSLIPLRDSQGAHSPA